MPFQANAKKGEEEEDGEETSLRFFCFSLVRHVFCFCFPHVMCVLAFIFWLSRFCLFAVTCAFGFERKP